MILKKLFYNNLKEFYKILSQMKKDERLKIIIFNSNQC